VEGGGVSGGWREDAGGAGEDSGHPGEKLCEKRMEKALPSLKNLGGNATENNRANIKIFFNVEEIYLKLMKETNERKYIKIETEACRRKC